MKKYLLYFFIIVSLFFSIFSNRKFEIDANQVQNQNVGIIENWGFAIKVGEKSTIPLLSLSNKRDPIISKSDIVHDNTGYPDKIVIHAKSLSDVIFIFDMNYGSTDQNIIDLDNQDYYFSFIESNESSNHQFLKKSVFDSYNKINIGNIHKLSPRDAFRNLNTFNGISTINLSDAINENQLQNNYFKFTISIQYTFTGFLGFKGFSITELDFAIVIDDQLPVISINNNQYFNESVYFNSDINISFYDKRSFNSNDQFILNEVSCLFNGNQLCNTNNLFFDKEGTLQIRLTDFAGNTNTVNLILDKTPVRISFFQSGQNTIIHNGSYNENVNLFLSDNSIIKDLEVEYVHTSPEGQISPFKETKTQLSFTDEGFYEIKSITDFFGNKTAFNNGKTSINFTIDKQGPKFIGIYDAFLTNEDILFQVNDELSDVKKVYMKYNDIESILSKNSEGFYTLDKEGDYQLWAEDSLGNESEKIIVRIDLSKPEFIGIFNGFKTSTEVSFQVVDNYDFIDYLNVIKDNQNFFDFTNEGNYFTFYEEGFYEVTTFDSAKNYSETITFVIDKTGPIILNQINEIIHKSSFEIEFTDELSSVKKIEVYLNNIFLGYDISVINEEGFYEIIAYDELDNKSIVNFYLDSKAPIVTNLIESNFLQLGHSLEFNDVIQKEINIIIYDDNLNIISRDSKYIFNNLGKFKVKITDNYNLENQFDFSIVTNDGPVIIISNSLIDNGKKIVEILSSFPLKEIYYQINETTTEADINVYRFEFNEEGKYKIYALDERERFSEKTFIIDRTPPYSNIKNNNVFFSKIKVTFSDNLSDNISAFITHNNQKIEIKNNFEVYSYGKYTLYLEDDFGNEVSLIFYVYENNYNYIWIILIIMPIIGVIIFIENKKNLLVQ
jgi:hypothetical protein